jgi:hypothetical protein
VPESPDVRDEGSSPRRWLTVPLSSELTSDGEKPDRTLLMSFAGSWAKTPLRVGAGSAGRAADPARMACSHLRSFSADSRIFVVTLREVAASIGMRSPSLYSHFDSKNAI